MHAFSLEATKNLSLYRKFLRLSRLEQSWTFQNRSFANVARHCSSTFQVIVFDSGTRDFLTCIFPIQWFLLLFGISHLKAIQELRVELQRRKESASSLAGRDRVEDLILSSTSILFDKKAQESTDSSFLKENPLMRLTKYFEIWDDSSCP